MTRHLTPIANWSLRISLAVAFLSAVLDRFGILGPPGAPNVGWGNWASFVAYTGTLNAFLPSSLYEPLAWIATIAEVVLAVWLLTGIQLRWAALASAALLLLFALAMTVALGVKAPLNYSVFTAAAGALALACLAERKPGISGS
ncbi:MAG: MauE/DoxX family redox-associated membrane protein [Verrucomicrobium sp.]